MTDGGSAERAASRLDETEREPGGWAGGSDPETAGSELDRLTEGYSHELRFWLNGDEVRMVDPDPDLLLVDYLRSPEVGLTGTKFVCGQGGCGACTVALSYYDPQSDGIVHRAVNACLRRVASLDGLAITTVEGLVDDGRMSPVQYQLAKDNGSQCGYCSPGFVMSLHTFLVDPTHHLVSGPVPTMLDIEWQFAGNICRCTGYRPILHAMKRFACDWDPSLDEGVLRCEPWPGDDAEHREDIRPTVTNLPTSFRPVRYVRGDRQWVRPARLDDVARLRAACGDRARLVHGGTAIQLVREWGGAEAGHRGPEIYIDLSRIGLLSENAVQEEHVRVGGGCSYTDALRVFDRALDEVGIERGITLRALHLAANRTAGAQVRNAGSLAGNTILCATMRRDGRRFPSDMVTALAGMGATVDVVVGEDDTRAYDVLEFLDAWSDEERLRDEGLILAYRIPFSRSGEYAETYRVARRAEDSTATVNAGLRLRIEDDNIAEASFVFGGIGMGPFHASRAEDAVRGRAWGPEAIEPALAALVEDIEAVRSEQAEDLEALAETGISDAYRAHLAQSFLYKFFVSVALDRDPDGVPAEIAEAGRRRDRGLSHGRQLVPPDEADGVAGVPYLRQGAFRQATGAARYTHDLPLPPRGLHAAYVLSERALARFRHVVPGGTGGLGPGANGDAGSAGGNGSGTAAVREHLRGMPGFVDYLGAEDLPTPGPKPENTPQYDPLLADGLVTCWGQPVALLIADSERAAIELARYARKHCIEYGPVLDDEGRPLEPILGIAEARERPDGAMPDDPPYPIHIAAIERPETDLSWRDADGEVVLDGDRCDVVRGVMETGGQAHFYLETQACLAVPGEHDEMVLHSSSQWPRGVHDGAATTLGLPHNAISVRIGRVGGAYGGKTTRTPFVSSPVAAAAHRLGRAVRAALPRDTDTAMIGKRHPFRGEFAIAVSNGSDGEEGRGRIKGLAIDFFADGGNTYDCSMNVLDCAQLQADGCYLVPNYRTSGTVCRTHTASNNAMRSYGVIQCHLAQEEAIEAAAHRLGILPEEVRRVSFYASGDETPAGQVLEHCHLREIWERLEERADFRGRLEEVDAFNRANRWRKRGISMIPLKYGLGFYASFLEQGGALVDVYQADGTVRIHHGGVEMGQGVWTRVAQLAARTLNVPPGIIRTTTTDTSVVADPISTGASSGTMLNGGAIQEACADLRGQLEAFVEDLRQEHDDDWFRERGLNCWDYDEGWRAETEVDGSKSTIWAKLVQLAYNRRVPLAAVARFRTDKRPFPHGIHFGPGIEEEVDQFDAFVYAAACSEVEIDVLTGETMIRRTDILYDMGQSINPALDIGQIEGSFVQGVGQMLTEELVWEPSGPERGRLNTLNVMDYKPPGPSTIPVELNVDLFPRDEGDLPVNPAFLPASEGAGTPVPMTSKGVGEPPYVLASTVHFALKHAILAARRHRGEEGWFRLDTPATVDRVREACLVGTEDLKLWAPSGRSASD